MLGRLYGGWAAALARALWDVWVGLPGGRWKYGGLGFACVILAIPGLLLGNPALIVLGVAAAPPVVFLVLLIIQQFIDAWRIWQSG